MAKRSDENVVKKYDKKTIDGCRTCPPRKACVGTEISIETSGCLEGGNLDFNLRQPDDQVIALHVDCPGNGKLTITTCEALKGGGEFTANQKCATDIDLCLNTKWLDRFVMSRIGDGMLKIEGDDSIHGDVVYTANQANDTRAVFGVNWDQFPACGGRGGMEWNGNCWKIDWSKVPFCEGMEWDEAEGGWRIDWLQWPNCLNGGILGENGCYRIDWTQFPNALRGGIIAEDNSYRVDWHQFPWCQDSGIIKQNECYKVNADYLLKSAKINGESAVTVIENLLTFVQAQQHRIEALEAKLS